MDVASLMFENSMIYTVGIRINYDNYIATDPNAAKAAGGSVWKTLKEIEKYLRESNQAALYAAYGVEADWDKDTEPVATEGANWRSLTRDAKLRNLLLKHPSGIPWISVIRYGEMLDEYIEALPNPLEAPSIPMDLVINK